MSVLLETSLGDIVIDLLPDQAPKCCENFLKLCKTKYYNYAPIHTVQPNFTLQTGDPLGPTSADSDGGSSIWGNLHGPASRAFVPEITSKLKHEERGTVSMATAPSTRDPDVREAASQFLITLGDKLEYLDGKAAVFGRVVEGFDVLEKINSAFVDKEGRPLKDIRIRHTIVLDEADIPDPAGLVVPPESPTPTPAQLATVRIADDEDLAEETDQDALEKIRREREAKAQALTLEMVGDLPFAEVAPPENVLFVCKLNPVTRDEDLELIFSRFGAVLSCEVIRDKRTGDSLQYAFVEFAEREMAEAAYAKMQSVLIDDARIHVDFSQSVSRLADVWRSGENKRRFNRKGGGGFGGIEGLEKKRQYRATEREVKRGDGGYGMVIDRDTHAGKGSGRRPSRSRSRSPPHRHRERDDYRGSREQQRGYRDRKDDYRDHGRRRDREHDRDRRERSTDRDRGGGRDRDRKR